MNINNLFKAATDNEASDLHIIVGKPPILRVDGELKVLPNTPTVTKEIAERMIFSILTERQKKTFIEERELDVSYEIPEYSRYRVNLHWEKDNVGLVSRVISKKIPEMEDLGLPKITEDLIQQTNGLILVTGPTGCGKSTTLAAMIEKINQTRMANIITLEDPIEFVHNPKKSIIKQRQLGTDIITFKDALRHILRQDPNVIMVGEMRDLETMAATITLAETGHLVLATLHTHNTAQTIDRIIDVFPPHQQSQVRLQLSISLSGVICQKLLPKINGGRVAVRELLINNPAVANVIRENKIPQIKRIVQTSAEEGMFSMQQNIKELLSQNIIDEVIALAYLNNI
ncbi:MAG: type IV pili twitching motility protein PilT [Candidatus Komeilibacteria bacterium CG11_big_fil_rev_8_21_14_0_20_36_20]|uniref:Type IV pili twitching motility protein PilT n=1 Tax=Candidatus Komeilibacteria bacterium CG11_big_fil_rev_8_21_14_0_20_36_20 TaxID=1974477 RepID=A0A2H0NCA2_9BACT|nr:MAG: type IV pili twitching motility protein PilT [Candidatus Komeilibacteria bacterium CG11_big_fil_rev_8_21_14_0_20_36_20]PIR81770.1 MAG: type IV pili twitching motility protein PilT [Candidatus Komeilibacteria bacterium CG10_big_fil_rev_8_21_14_0_10_36_65]PJC55808.1 MAG: type IV pili twitching motility protein PilT [Candidatus Komeilibacteria bacterium CG_4_9_14_0_2_um_filter_36_13]